MQLTGTRPDGFDVTPPGQGWILGVVIALLSAIFELDHRTGAAPYQHLYYVPIILAGARLGWWAGPATAIAAVGLYHVANPGLIASGYKESDFVQIALFIAVGFVTARLTADARRLKQLAMTDDLTGLSNLRAFEARLAPLIRLARQRVSPLSLMVFDVDRLKALNDTHGHLTGAEAVRTVGHLVAARLPRAAIACRFGGDEFVVAIPDCPAAEVLSIADDLRRAVHAVAPTLAGVPFPPGTLSISIGVASTGREQRGVDEDSDHAAGEALFSAADRALYVAKTGGRNRVSAAQRSGERQGEERDQEAERRVGAHQHDAS
jgi:diguanylate cyclase (GGDEF)-like protein